VDAEQGPSGTGTAAGRPDRPPPASDSAAEQAGTDPAGSAETPPSASPPEYEAASARLDPPTIPDLVPVPGPTAGPGAGGWPGPVAYPAAASGPDLAPRARPVSFLGISGRLPAAGPPRTHRWGLGAYLLVELVFLLTSVAVGVLVVGNGPPRAWTLALALSVPTLLAAGTAVLITHLRGNGPRADLRLTWSWSDVRLGLLFGIGGLFVTLPASMLYLSIVGPDATSAVGEVFGDVRASLPLALVIFATVVFVAPLCEEIVYRGLLWGAVERLRVGRWVPLVVTTLLFALAHFEFTRTPLLLVVAIPIALARFYTGGLLASIVAHQVNNLLPGVALMLGLVGAIPMS
jgi:membrane protease YdiL (CAAX protease family)